MVSRDTWFTYQANKRRRLTHGGPAAGFSGSGSVLKDDDPHAGQGGGRDCSGVEEDNVDDCPPVPDHPAEGGAAACSEDSPLSADQDVDQAGKDEESSAASSDVGSVDSMDVPPVAFVVEDADDAGPLGPTLEPAGLPQSEMQGAVSSNEVLLPVEQFSRIGRTWRCSHTLWLMV